MKSVQHLIRKTLRVFILAAVPVLTASAQTAVPADVDHAPLDTLLQKYVDDKGLVDYSGWHASSEDVARLASYLAQFAPESTEAAQGDELVASLINAYNAFTIKFILDNLPTESIRLLDEPFDGKRNLVGGARISVDEIEHELLRPIIGWKAHSVVVCAARSCPPLLNRAYFASDWEDKMEERYRTWLARSDLSQYDSRRNQVKISKIFDWYSEDFKGPHSTKAILRRFGPSEHRSLFQSEDYKIRFMDYHWGLNAQSDLGADYRHSIFRSLF